MTKTSAKKMAVNKGMTNAFFECPSRTAFQNKTLKPAVLDYLIEQMFGEDGKWCKAYIDSQLKEAKNNPNSRAADRLAAGIFNDCLWDKLDEYLSKAKAEDVNYYKYLIRQTLYDKQKEVFDNDIDQRFIIINSRRSGKTELMGRLVAKGILQPDGHIVYINRNSSAAIRQIRGPFEDAMKVLSNVTITRGSVEAQEVHFSNGSQLLVLGNNNSADIDKLRGERISMCIMDECGHQKNIRQLMREVIGPALKDYGKDSRLYMVGTPPRIPHTYVEEVWNNATKFGWKRYHWTYQENPFIPDRDSIITEVCKENGVTPDSAFIQREYFGRMGVYDTEAVVFKGYKTYNSLQAILRGYTELLGDDLPNGKKEIFKPTGVYIGIDWGGTDYNAIVSVVVDAIAKKAFVYDVWTDRKCGLEVIKSIIQRKYNDAQELLSKYGIEDDRIRIVTDTNMVEFAVDLCKLGLPVTKAIKYDMMTSIETMAAELRTGRLRVPSEWKAEDNRLIQDFEDTVYKRDEETDALLREIDDDTYHPDAAHALRYAMRQYMEDGQWVYGRAGSNRETDKTIPAGFENLKEYGTMNLSTDSNEEFIV